MLPVCDFVTAALTELVTDDVIVGVPRVDIVIDCVTVEVFDTDDDVVVVPEMRTDRVVVVERLIVTVPVGVRLSAAVAVPETVIRGLTVRAGDPELVLDIIEEAVTVEETVDVFETVIERETDADPVLVFDVLTEPVEVRVIGGVRLTLGETLGDVVELAVFELLMDREDVGDADGVFEPIGDNDIVGDEDDVFDTVIDDVEVFEDVIDFVWAADAVLDADDCAVLV